MIRRSSLFLGATAMIIFLFILIAPFSKEATEQVSQHATKISSWYTAEEDIPIIATPESSSQLNWTKVATMIETRNSPMLIPILQSWLANVPSDWPFVIWTGIENHDILSKAAVFQYDIKIGRLNFTRIDFPGTAYQPDPHQTSTLSDFLCNTNYFWTQFHPEAEWMVFFQADSVLCSMSDQTVDDWIGYDFIGGPSPWSHGPGMDRHGGNGGFSMRKISSLRNITTETPRKPDESPEDVWFTRKLQAMEGIRWPELEDRPLERFSISGGWIEDKSHAAAWKPLGVHHGLGHIGDVFEGGQGKVPNALHKIIQSCPEFLYLRYAMDEFHPVDLAQLLGPTSAAAEPHEDSKAEVATNTIISEEATTTAHAVADEASSIAEAPANAAVPVVNSETKISDLEENVHDLGPLAAELLESMRNGNASEPGRPEFDPPRRPDSV